MKQLLIALLLLYPSVALADPAPNGSTLAIVPDPTLSSTNPVHGYRSFAKSMRMRHALEALRDEGLKMQAADGGTLTKPHHDYLQSKYEGILAGNY